MDICQNPVQLKMTQSPFPTITPKQNKHLENKSPPSMANNLFPLFIFKDESLQTITLNNTHQVIQCFSPFSCKDYTGQCLAFH